MTVFHGITGDGKLGDIIHACRLFPELDSPDWHNPTPDKCNVPRCGKLEFLDSPLWIERWIPISVKGGHVGTTIRARLNGEGGDENNREREREKQWENSQWNKIFCNWEWRDASILKVKVAECDNLWNDIKIIGGKFVII